MHPTPAVGGAPRRAALEWLEEHEALERGWYAGPVGFVDAEGGGEFSVALRSALLRADTARLYAGAGIVSGSEPAAELRETQLKLRAMLGALVEL
jgi:isochorismate synthase EntC